MVSGPTCLGLLKTQGCPGLLPYTMALSLDQAGSDGQMTVLGPAGVTLVTGRVLQPPSWPTQPPPEECGQGRWKGLFLYKTEQALKYW